MQCRDPRLDASVEKTPYRRDRLPTAVFLIFLDSPASKEPACNAGDPGSVGVGKICWRRDRLPTPVFLGFPGGSAGEESTRNAGDLGSIPGWGRSPGGGLGNPLQYSCLENPHGQKSLVGYRPWGCRAGIETHMRSTDMCTQSRVRAGMNWENGIEMYTLLFIK